MPIGRAGALLLVFGLLVACGGRTVLGVEPYAEDAGDAGTDAASKPDALRSEDTGVGRDTGLVIGSDTGVVVAPCPPTDAVFGLGAPCAWSGSCTIELDACDAGGPLSVACLCSEGVVALPPGEGVGCASTGASCPPGLSIGGACTGDVSCQTDFCGPGDIVTCACSQGVWECPGATCVPPMCGGGCDDGRCIGADGCGGTVLCVCGDGGVSCPIVEC